MDHRLIPQQGIGLHSSPLLGAPFGLYRPAGELRAVFAHHEERARGACRYWREKGRAGGQGGCDQPILLGNDPLYGGLGGEFTYVPRLDLQIWSTMTAWVLRHLWPRVADRLAIRTTEPEADEQHYHRLQAERTPCTATRART